VPSGDYRLRLDLYGSADEVGEASPTLVIHSPIFQIR
jgi:hypothetical protein